jgi:hypothetical protein
MESLSALRLAPPGAVAPLEITNERALVTSSEAHVADAVMVPSVPGVFPGPVAIGCSTQVLPSEGVRAMNFEGSGANTTFSENVINAPVDPESVQNVTI